MINFALNIKDVGDDDDDDVPPTLEEETAEDDDAEGTRMEDID